MWPGSNHPVIPTKAKPRGGIRIFAAKGGALRKQRKKNGSFDALRLLRMTYDYTRFPVVTPARSRQASGGFKALPYKSCEKIFAAAAYFIRNVHKIVIDRSALRAMIAVQKIGLAMGKIF